MESTYLPCFLIAKLKSLLSSTALPSSTPERYSTYWKTPPGSNSPTRGTPMVITNFFATIARRILSTKGRNRASPRLRALIFAISRNLLLSWIDLLSPTTKPSSARRDTRSSLRLTSGKPETCKFSRVTSRIGLHRG